jgi:hypothetical protein
MRLRGIVAMLMVSAAASAGDVDGVVADVTKRFAAAIKCGPGDRDLQRAWCSVARAGKEAPKLPATPVTYFGLTVALKPGDDVKTALLGALSPSALHLGPSGARLTGLKPDNEQEKRELLEAGMSASIVLKGEKASVVVPKGLAGYLDSQRAKPMHPVTVRGTGADFTGNLPARLLASDKAWVVIEQATDGVWVNVYPIAPIERR